MKHYIDHNDNRVLALAKFLGTDAEDAANQIDSGDYLVCTDEEADSRTADAIEELLWAFRPSFLWSTTGIDAEVFEAIQKNDRCEYNNPAILSIIRATCGLASFVKLAIQADGRGHFLAGYDGEENAETIDGEKLFIYRNN